MVDFESKDRIALIKKLIEEQKKQEEDLSKEELELKKKQEELEKKKAEAKKKQEEVGDALEDALEAETKDFRESEFRRTDINLQTVQRREELATPTSEKKEVEEEVIQENNSSQPELHYRRMPQTPSVSDVYRQIETIYKHIPQQLTKSNAQVAQRELYHELKAMANHWGTQRAQVEQPSESQKHYGQEVMNNPHSESSTWQRLSERVRAMAQQAGNDEFQYQQRTEIVLNQIRHNFEEREYKLQDKEDAVR